MKKCFLDLDGVLVDFVKGACAIHDRPCPYTGTDYRDFYFNEKWLMSGPDLYKDMGKDFWSNLEWMPDGKEIFHAVDCIFGSENVCILTHPCPTDGCYDGKMLWIARNLPKGYSRRVLAGGAKEFCASPQRVLIDDYDKNAEAFAGAGGQVVLIPRPWNRNRGLNAIEFLLTQDYG